MKWPKPKSINCACICGCGMGSSLLLKIMLEGILEDYDIEKIALGALEEASNALQKEYNFPNLEMQVWKENVVKQTNNPIVGDTVLRYAADPIRKLKKDDRLVGPALLCIKNGINPEKITLAIAACLCFHDDNDPTSLKMQNMITRVGIKQVVTQICGLTKENDELINKILDSYFKLIVEGKNAIKK